MALYEYEAADKNGRIVRGEYDATNEEGVVRYLTGRHLIPVHLALREGKEGEKKLKKDVFQRVTSLDQILLVRNLSIALTSGVGLLEALDMLLESEKKALMYEILLQAKAGVVRGAGLADTFRQYPQYFSSVFVGLIEAGEKSGKLDEMLTQLNDYLTREFSLKKKIKSAMMYPIILLVAAAGVVSLLMFFTVPRLASLFESINVPLPLPTRIFLGISRALTYSVVLDLVVVAGIVALVIWMQRSVKGRQLMHRTLRKIPVAREVMQNIALVRFTRTLQHTMSVGIPVTEALGVSAKAIGEDDYTIALADVAEHVRKGQSVSEGLASFPELFPVFLTNLLRVGEQTGSIERILTTFADIYEQEVDSSLKNLTATIEPAMLIILGVIIGTIAISMMYPIYSFIGELV